MVISGNYPAYYCYIYTMAPVIKRINDYNAGIPATLQEMKWKALQESPFRFYRGTCHLFAQDFVKMYKDKPKVKTWICGDLHFENFGSFKGENRQVYFDLNDFDESILAGPEAEIARFITSIVIAAGQMKTGAIGLHKTIHDIMEAYTETIDLGKAMMMERDVSFGHFKTFFENLETFDRQSFIDKHTYKHKGALLIKTDNVHFMPIDESRKALIFDGMDALLEHNDHFKHLVIEDIAYRIAGTGSLGLERYCVLCFSKKKGKRYLIDVKQSRPSCYSGLMDVKQPTFDNEAIRVKNVGYMMQFNSPAFLTSVEIDGIWYLVKEMQLVENKMAVADFEKDFKGLSEVAVEMARLMAYAHLRSSGRMGSSTIDELRKFANKHQWQKDIIELCGDMAKKNSKYFKEFCKVE